MSNTATLMNTLTKHKKKILFSILLIGIIIPAYYASFRSTLQSSDVNSIVAMESFEYENSQNWTSYPHTRSIMVTGHGRSGSTLMGTFFIGKDWKYYFEPLKSHNWNETIVKMHFEGEKSTCRINTRLNCPVSDAIYLMQILRCRRHDLIDDVVMKELQGHTGLELIDEMAKKMNFNITSSCAPKVDGVAIKTIRMNGDVELFFKLSDKLKVRTDLVIHLLRDPRAVLASRLSVGWGTPRKRNYSTTYLWSKEMCDQTMQDYNYGKNRKEYILLRYEDMAAAAVDTAKNIYDRIGLPVPTEVMKKMKENDQESHSKAVVPRKDAKSKSKYGTEPRNFQIQLLKWQNNLNQAEIRAVQDACEEVYRTHYSDWKQLVQGF